MFYKMVSTYKKEYGGEMVSISDTLTGVLGYEMGRCLAPD